MFLIPITNIIPLINIYFVEMICYFFRSTAKELIKYDYFHIHSLRYSVDVIEV